MYSHYKIQRSLLCVAKDRGLQSIQSGLLARTTDGLPSTTEKTKNLKITDLFIPGRALVLDAPIRISIIFKFKKTETCDEKPNNSHFFELRKISVKAKLIVENMNIFKRFDVKLYFLRIYLFYSQNR